MDAASVMFATRLQPLRSALCLGRHFFSALYRPPVFAGGLRSPQRPGRDENPAITTSKMTATTTLSPRFYHQKNRLYGCLNPEDFAPKTEINPKKAGSSPQLTTNAEEEL
jgi:hypothetical protein